MRNSDSKTPVLIMALIVAAIGIAIPLCLSRLFVNPRLIPTPPVQSSPTPAPAPFTTISVLLIGTDSLAGPQQPNLESVAVIKYQTEVHKYFLIGVSPDTITCPITSTQPQKKLRDWYAEDARRNRQSVLTQAALEKISKELGGIYAEVDFDRQAVLDTLRPLGTVSCLGQTGTGEQWLNRFDALPVTAVEERLHFQGSFLQCLFKAAQHEKWDFPKLMNQLARRRYPTPDRVVLTFEAAPPLPQSEISLNYTPLNPFDTATPQP